MGAETDTPPITGPSHVDIQETMYAGRKSGYCGADILQYKRFNVRGKGEPEKVIKFEDGTLYAPGPRGMPTPVIEVQKGLDESFRKEMMDIVNYFEKANFKVENLAIKAESPKEEAAKATIKKGNIRVTLNCEIRDEQFSWPLPSSFSYYSLFTDKPKRYVGKRAILGFEISKLGEISEEEKLLVEGINVDLLQKHKFRNY